MQSSSMSRTLHLHREAATLQWSSGPQGGAVVLRRGRAELFRSPLTLNQRYSFPAETCVLIEAAEGAELQLEGAVTIGVAPLNGAVDEIHALLDTARADATLAIQERETAALSSSEELRETWQGPRVLVVGENQWEREATARSLLNLAVRRGSPYGVGFVDVDVAMPLVGCPGTVSAVFVEEPVTAPEDFDGLMPLTFFHGAPSVTSATRKRYLDLCVCVAQAATSLGFAKPQFEAGGLVVHTMSPASDLQHALLSDMISNFAVTHVVVTGADYELEKFLSNAVLGRSVTFLRAPRWPGVAAPSADAIAARRRRQLNAYFYGTVKVPRLPVRGVVKVGDVELLHAETLQHLASGDVPDLSVAAVVWADTAAAAEEANVAGFVVLLEVGRYYVSFLAPSGGELPKPFLIVSPTLQLPRELVMPLYATESAS